MNYSELIAASQAYADRNDLEVRESMETFILMAEARINRVLKTRKQSTSTYTPTVDDQEFYSLPPDYAGMRDIQLNSDLPDGPHKSASFTMLTPELFNIQRNKPSTGKNFYSIIGNQIQIFPVQKAGQTIQIVYYQKVQALSNVKNANDDFTENWLSIDHPDIYLAGITAEISLFAKDYDTADGWSARMSLAIEELDNTDVVERWSGTPLTMRVG